MSDRTAVLRGIIFVSVLAAAVAMAVASIAPGAGEAAVAVALTVSFLFSLFATRRASSHRRARHATGSTSAGRGTRYEGEPAGVPH